MVTGLVFNALLTSLVTALAYESYLTKHPSRPVWKHHDTRPLTAATSETKLPVWIDTDPACGVEKTADVDDCWALLAAVRSPELHVVGVSTVFGNQPGEQLEEFVRDILPTIGEGHKDGEGRPRVFTGSMRPSDGDWRQTPASEAMASALRKTKLIIIALGPLTNIATLINTHPDLAAKIGHIIMVAGKHPGQLYQAHHHTKRSRNIAKRECGSQVVERGERGVVLILEGIPG